MTAPIPLPRVLGTTERTLRALLAAQLDHAGITFGQWTALQLLDDAPLTQAQLADKLSAGQIATATETRSVVQELVARGWVTVGPEPDEDLQVTDRVVEEFHPIRDRVRRVTGGVVDGLDESDVVATRRVLAEMTRRAAALIAETGNS